MSPQDRSDLKCSRNRSVEFGRWRATTVVAPVCRRFAGRAPRVRTRAAPAAPTRRRYTVFLRDQLTCGIEAHPVAVIAIGLGHDAWGRCRQDACRSLPRPPSRHGQSGVEGGGIPGARGTPLASFGGPRRSTDSRHRAQPHRFHRRASLQHAARDGRQENRRTQPRHDGLAVSCAPAFRNTATYTPGHCGDAFGGAAAGLFRETAGVCRTAPSRGRTGGAIPPDAKPLGVRRLEGAALSAPRRTQRSALQRAGRGPAGPEQPCAPTRRWSLEQPWCCCPTP